MSMAKRSGDALQKMMNAFKLFEMKLDKLQDDVNYQGQTLCDLRIMVADLSGSHDFKHDHDEKSEIRGPLRKTTAIQYDDYKYTEDPGKVKRRNAIQPFQSKIKAKSFQSQKFDSRLYDTKPTLKKLASSSPKGTKLSIRPFKAEAPRKATTLRTQKSKIEKKRTKTNK